MPHALVLGLGASGLAIARWLAAQGRAVVVADTRADPPQLAALREQLPEAQFRSGEFHRSLLEDVDLLALSPGLSPTSSPAAPLLKAAAARKIEIVGEIELFARELARLKGERAYMPTVIAVTGTNGKTTTTRLVGLMLERSGRRVAVAGNIGPAALDVLRERLAADDLPEAWVLELSSFQLATTRSLRCDVATVLNVTDDHLDWHGSIDAYAAAKARIFTAGTVQVLNRDNPRVAEMARKNARIVTFGAGVPSAADAYGIAIEHGMAWLAWSEDVSASARRRKTDETAQPPELHLHRLMPADALRIRGRHNAMNALAALALARAAGCPLAPLLNALRDYEGEPHRVQLIATVADVQYYDDSKGTNVGATVAALEGLGAEGRQLVPILGGDGKGQDFAPLASPLARHARAVVLIGRDAAKIRAALEAQGSEVSLTVADTLEHAVASAARLARAGDAVLLSPACASLDMFRDYVHRAQVFTEAVRELAAEAGQPC